MRERPVMSDQQRKRLAVACLENALNLIRHSEVLLAGGAIPYAQFLAGSAWEEILKARYCIEGGGTWKRWWDGFYDHKAKLNLARPYWPDRSLLGLDLARTRRTRGRRADGRTLPRGSRRSCHRPPQSPRAPAPSSP
jgi:AbiV